MEELKSPKSVRPNIRQAPYSHNKSTAVGACLMFMFVILAAAMMASIAAVEREEEEAELLKRPQQLPAHFNPGLATHTVRSQPMLTPRGRKVPDWVSAQRLPPAQESTSSMAAGEQPTL